MMMDRSKTNNAYISMVIHTVPPWLEVKSELHHMRRWKVLPDKLSGNIPNNLMMNT